MVIVPPSLLAAAACAALGAGPGDEHRINWARAAVGAKVVVAPAIHPTTDIRNLIGERLGRGEGPSGHTILADTVQHERIVIDLGQQRLIGRLFVGSGTQDSPRHPDRVNIRGSLQSAEGPWTVLVADGNMGLQHTFVFDNTPVRFLEIDFGQTTHQRGTRITSLGAFTRYRCPRATQVVQWLAQLYHRKAEGLTDFFQAADAERWDEAVRLLRQFYAQRFQERPTEASERSRKIADDMVAHRFQFGDPAHTFGPKVEDIDWAYQLDYEWTNSLNRCGFWTHTAIVYMATGDARYAREIEAQLLHWIESCPLPPPSPDGRYYSWQRWDSPARITWRSLDSAIRLWKLVELVPLFAADPEHFSDRALTNLLYSVWEHLDYLTDDDWDGGNWLSTVNSSALDAAVSFPEFRDSPKWLTFAKSAFETNVLRDVREDGKEIENSVGYVQFAYSSMFNVLKTLTERGVEVNPEARRRLDLLQDFIAWCMLPDMTSPMIGDADRGGPYPLDRTWPFFGRQDIRYIITQGQEGEPPAVGSRYWQNSGWAVMRSPWDQGPFTDALHMVFKASPSGPHGHLDQLSLTLYAYGRALLMDPGRCNYRAEGRVFASTPYHNTVTVDGANQAPGSASFETWRSADDYDLAVGSHGLYRGVTHRRAVLFVKPHFWLVRDDLASGQEHRYEQRWHFPDGADPQELADHAVTTRFAQGANLLVVPLTPIAESSAEDYEIAYRWDDRVPARLWSYVPESVPIVTLLVPYRGTRPPRLVVEALALSENATEVRLSIGDRAWHLRLAQDEPSVVKAG
ncbi:MAG: alginate lyase family protein [Armatimonadota bacterium]